MQIGTPWALLLLLLIPLMFLLNKRFSRKTSLKVASIKNFKGLKKTLKQRLMFLPLVLRVLVIILLICAIARPRVGREKVINHSEGIAIEMVLDRSSSMAKKMKYKGKYADRLEVAKKVFLDFVNGKDGLDGRDNDLIGMVSFARFSDTISPLTLDHKVIPQFLDQIHLVNMRSEDGTAISDAVELAAARLYTAEKELKERKFLDKDDYNIKSKIIILLTDGKDNISRTGLPQVAKICADWGIKVYSIGIGGGESVKYLNTFVGKIPVNKGGYDEKSLRYISEKTGGKFFRADSEESLEKIYKEIDALEKSQVESVKYTEYAEKFPLLALVALAVVLVEVLLRATFFRILP